MHSYEELLQLQSSLSLPEGEQDVEEDHHPRMEDSLAHSRKQESEDQSSSSTARAAENDDIVLLRESIEETNQLLHAFRRSLLSTATLPTPPPSRLVIHSTINTPRDEDRFHRGRNTLTLTSTRDSGNNHDQSVNSSNAFVQEVDISSVLEQYSDRLLEVFSAKFQEHQEKLQNKQTISK